VTGALDKLSDFAFGKVRAQKEAHNKILGIQLRGDFESETQQRLAELKVRVDSRQITDTRLIQEEIRALSGYAVELAKIDPTQANGLLTNINAAGRALMAKAADQAVQDIEIESSATADKTIESLQENLQAVYLYADSEETISLYEDAARGMVRAVSPADKQKREAKLEAFEKARGAAMRSAAAEFIRTSPNKSLAYVKLLNGQTDNPTVDLMLRGANREEFVAGARKEIQAFEDAEQARVNLTKRQISDLKADFTQAFAQGSKPEQDRILSELYALDKTAYTELVKARDEGGGLFADRDYGWAVSELVAKTGSVNGPVLTVQDVLDRQKYLTPGTTIEFMNKARVLGEAQTQRFMKLAQARLGLMGARPINPGAARLLDEKIYNNLLTRWTDAVVDNPDLDPKVWMSENLENVRKDVSGQGVADLVGLVTGRSIRTLSGFDEEIRKSRSDPSRVTELVRQKNELQQAINQGLVDRDGKRIGAQ
jgi:hypothetical protein